MPHGKHDGMTPHQNKLFRLPSVLGLALLLGLTAFVSSCSKNSALVGKWQGKDASEIAEFRADGTFKFSGGEPMSGTFSFNGSELSFKLDGDLGKALGTVTAQASIEGDTLKISDSKKAPLMFTRG